MGRTVAAALALAAGVASASTCSPKWDGPTRETGGPNFQVVANITQDECGALCCKLRECVALSWNYPMDRTADGCVKDGTCCYLKDQISGVGPNHYGGWVHTAQVAKPPADLVPTPSALQDKFMRGDWAEDGSTVGGFTQFMHFSVTTFGNVEHDCIDGACLPASEFAPTALDADQWVRTAKGMGVSQICLTAHHEGGFCLWPTSQQPYSVANSKYGKDVLKPFVEACKRHNISICYYIGPNANGYLTQVEKASPEVFVEKQLNMTKEVLENYGPVDRLWWDHFDNGCGGLSECPGGFPQAWPRFVDLVRETSPGTVIGTGPDIGHSVGGETGVGSYPRWLACNTTDGTNASHCASSGPLGFFFKPREADATIQNPGDRWFWHPGHAFWNRTEIWEHFFLTWGRGDAFILNMPPNTTGVIPQAYADEGAAFGDALRASLSKPLAEASSAGPAPCADAVLELTVPSAADAFLTREDMSQLGQRIASYAVEALDAASGKWVPLPPLDVKANTGVHGVTVGYRIVDRMPEGAAQPAGTRVRVRCTSSLKDPVRIESFGAYKLAPP